MSVVPLSGTSIALYSGIPFNKDYKHTRWFDSLADQLNWFASQTHVATITQSNFQRIEGRSFFKVKMPIDQLWGVNYFSFQNADLGKVFYAFVTKLEYSNGDMTIIHFELDVLQTWMFDLDFKPSFVVREHCPLWNSDGTPVVNTVDEGLAYGTEYDTVYVTNFQPSNGYKWLVIVAKSNIHEGTNLKKIIPTVIGVPQPLSVYVVPFKTNDTVPAVTLSDGTGVVISKPTDVLTNLYQSDNAINNIVSLYMTDFIGVNVSVTPGTPDVMTFPQDGSVFQPAQIKDSTGTIFFNCLYVQKVSSFGANDINLGAKYLGYKPVKESKLLMYPYTQLMIDDFKGNRASFKNEYINDTTLYVTAKGSMGTSNKVSYGIQAYNSDTNDNKLYVSDEFALINNEPSDIPVLDDNLAAFLQGHRNSINNQKTSILWNGTMNGIHNGTGAVGSLATGNLIGAIQSGTSYVQGLGNTNLQIQAIEAKLQDISNVPPSLTKMGSNSSYSFGNQYNGIYVIKKQIKDEYIDKLTDYFNMFGYKMNKVKIPNFHTRQNWNYIQTKSCVIRASINNEDLEEVKAIFDSGITLWHNDDIGNYTMSNNVIA
jgi:hypothetical protein